MLHPLSHLTFEAKITYTRTDLARAGKVIPAKPLMGIAVPLFVRVNTGWGPIPACARGFAHHHLSHLVSFSCHDWSGDVIAITVSSPPFPVSDFYTSGRHWISAVIVAYEQGELKALWTLAYFDFLYESVTQKRPRCYFGAVPYK